MKGLTVASLGLAWLGPRRAAVRASVALVVMLVVALLLPLTGAVADAGQEMALAQQLRRQALPLDLADEASLAPLLRHCDAARLILLGDATHGSEEFYRLRRQLSLALMAHQRVDFLVLEADAHSCLALDAYVRLQPGAPASAIAALRQMPARLGWVWQTRELALLLEDLRCHNARLPAGQRVALYGMDLLDYDGALCQLQTRLGPLPALRQVQECFGVGADPDRYVRALLAGTADCQTELAALRPLLPSAEQLFVQWRGAETLIRLRLLLGLQAAEAYYRRQLQDSAAAWNLRVRHFADQLRLLLRHHGPESRALVWAHNTHVGDARFTAMPDWGMVSLGQLLRQEWGPAAVFLLGQTGALGQVRASRDWGAADEVLTLAPPRADSVEALLLASGLATGLWLFAAAEAASPFDAWRDQRAVGVVYRPERDATDNYLPSRLSRRYDALVFFRQLQPTTLLEGQLLENRAWP
ncbi:erythromycin esterase family protein [Desulfuromonas thiophila]|uniref:Erythromycin esterase homolog n=1 Tax=Desulfuromonas thiophila TaxID=57664 RepID=A0A1G7CBJ8_9BACT|nr:erythromycin esterase family protein [Desulfuromonas thiophila]SDE36689.1 Erythromycin esterase homolog [Desulfuromonas thiophila]